MIIKQYSFLLPVPRGRKICPWDSCTSLLASLSVPFFRGEGGGFKQAGAAVAVQARLLRCDRTEETKNSGKRTGVVGAVGHCPTDWTSGGDVLSFSVWRRCPLWAANPLPGSKGPQACPQARREHTRGIFPSEWGSWCSVEVDQIAAAVPSITAQYYEVSGAQRGCRSGDRELTSTEWVSRAAQDRRRESQRERSGSFGGNLICLVGLEQPGIRTPPALDGTF